MANRVVGAKGHEPCGPRDKFSAFFRSRYSIGYLEYQPFFVKSKSKARHIELSGLRDMISAALETSSLPSSGFVTPSATSSTNLSLLSQSQRHGLSSSRR